MTQKTYEDGYKDGLLDAAKAAEGWETNAAGNDYQFDGSTYWDAGTVYDQGRFDAAEKIRSLAKKEAGNG